MAKAKTQVRSQSGEMLRAFVAGMMLLLVSAFVFVNLAQAQSVRPPSNAVNSPSVTGPSNSLGNQSDTDLWRKIRRAGKGQVSIGDPNAGVMIQSQGQAWRDIRNGSKPIVGPLTMGQFGAYAMGGILALLALFFLLRGRIRMEHGQSGFTVTRFGGIERTAHWLLAVSFILLAITGLNITYGKSFLLPVIGKDAFAAFAGFGKLVHNYVAFAFIVGLVMIFVLWIKDNIPHPRDIKWLAKGGGMFSKNSHPEAARFNAGQKIIFWMVILGGASLVMSGIAMMFPGQTTMFQDTFVLLNKVGFSLPTALSPIQEMQYATIWHAIVAMFMTAVIFAHIYIGSIGMEGAFDAMGSGEVDENWAKEHHALWYNDVKARTGDTSSAPAAVPAE